MVMFKERNYKVLYKDPIFSSNWNSISLVQHMPLAPHPHDLANFRGHLHTENAREWTLQEQPSSNKGQELVVNTASPSPAVR